MTYLDKYYPQVDVFEHFGVDASLPRSERAFQAWKNLLKAKAGYQALFLVIGRELKRVRDEELFKELDYENFTEFLGSEELGFSREKAYLCIRSYEYLIEHLGLDVARVGEMNISRINMMIPVLKRIEEASGKEAAIEQLEDYNALRHTDFIREINQEKASKKPSVYFSEELDKWIVNYYDDTCVLHSLGLYEEKEAANRSEANQEVG